MAKKRGRPAQFDGCIRIPVDRKEREKFLLLCTNNKPRCNMAEALRHFMMLCVANKTILGLDIDK